MTVLLVGGTGRTGRRVLEQLLARGAKVRAIVRDAGRLPSGLLGHPGLTIVEAELLSMSDVDLASHARGSDAIVSCLGHVISLRGIFGPPWDLVARATKRLCRAGDGPTPMRLILMTSVSVNRPDRLDGRRGNLERAVLWMLRALVPPTRDNQNAADFLQRDIGASSPSVRWVVVRPDTLVEGGVSEYEAREGLVNSLFAPGRSRMANVAHFMCELVTDRKTWETWEGKFPVIVDREQGRGRRRVVGRISSPSRRAASTRTSHLQGKPVMPRTAAAISVVMAMPCGVIPGAFQPGPIQTSVYFNLNFPKPAGDASGMVRFNYNPQWR